MPRFRAALALLFLAGLLLPALSAIRVSGQDAPDESVSLAAVGDFVETFTGNPSSPTAFSPGNWELAKHTRSQGASGGMDSMAAGHGSDCAGPPATHSISNLSQSIFQCRDHIMTAIRADDYGLIYMTPPAMADWSAGEAVIRWDMSTLQTSKRDWMDIWLVPYDDDIQLPFHMGDVDLQGVPKRAVQFRTDDANGNGTMFRPAIYSNHNQTSTFQPFGGNWNWYTGWETFLASSATIRSTFELRVTQTHLSLCMPAYSFCWANTTIPSLGYTRAVVRFGHHSYTPFKDGNGGPTTRHWDNISISPSVPFTIGKATPAFSDSASTVITLPQPAPASAKLRFAAIGSNIQASVNGGPFVAATRPPQLPSPPDIDGHYASYHVNLPAGATSVRIQGGNWYGGGWKAKDFHLFALDVPPATATAIAATATAVSGTATAIATMTPFPPTATAVPPTWTPIASTPSPVPTIPSNSADTGHVAWRGTPWYLHGANLPWWNFGCDFGCNTNGGVRATKEQIRPVLRAARQAGMVNVRWWVFPTSAQGERPWQIAVDGNDLPTAVNQSALADMDAAVQLAREEDVVLHLVLFSKSEAIPRTWISNVQQRNALATALGRDLFARYKDEPRVMTWEVWNEPEIGIQEFGVNLGQAQEFVRAIVDAKRATAPLTHITVGTWRLEDLPKWRLLGLTYYSAHWYDGMGPGQNDAIHRDYADVAIQYGIDLPLVLGEVYMVPAVQTPNRWQALRDRGYAGSWGWSLASDHTGDGFVVDRPSAAAFFANPANDDIGPMLVTGPPATATSVAATATAIPAATATTQAATATAAATATSAAATATATILEGTRCRVQFGNSSYVTQFVGTIVGGVCTRPQP